MKFDYKVIYSGRKSVSVSISGNNEIIVRCPYGYKTRKIEELLQKKSAWIIKHYSANAAKAEQNSDLISYKCAMVKGKKLPLITGVKNEISQSAVYVKSLKNFKKLYCDNFSEEFYSRVLKISGATGLAAESVKFKNYTARWGCCDCKNNIVFNYKLFMLDESLWDYVIIHELCHTRYHNHSKDFWRLVEYFMPDYKRRRNKLKTFNFVASLY